MNMAVDLWKGTKSELRQENQPCQEGKLPIEIWQKTFEYLSPWDIIRCSGVSQIFRDMTQDDFLWKSKVVRALSDQAPLEEVNALALIYLSGKFRPLDENLGFRIGARAEDRIGRKVSFRPLEAFILSHVRLYYILDINFCSEGIASSLPTITAIQRLISEQNPFAIFSLGVENFANNKKEEAKAAFKTASATINIAAACLAICGDHSALDRLVSQDNGLANYYHYLYLVKGFQVEEQEIGLVGFINSCLQLLNTSQALPKGPDKEDYLVAAAKAEFPPAQACYAQKLFSNKKLEEGLFWAIEAANQNWAEAKILLGERYGEIIDLERRAPGRFPKKLIKALEDNHISVEKDYFMLGMIDSLKGKLSVEEKEVCDVWENQPLVRLGWTPYLLCLMYIKGTVFVKNEHKAWEYYCQFRNLSTMQMEQLPEINSPKELLARLLEIHNLVLNKS